MISLQRLAKLPRSQRLRKAASIFRNAEHRFVVMGKLLPEETEYLGRLAVFLADDDSFSDTAAGTLKEVRACFSAAGTGNGREIRRSLNSVYYVLSSETGHCQADWDFIGPSGKLDPFKRQPFTGVQIYFEDIRSPFNVGSMFRVAESFGAEKIWLSLLCADPRHKRAERTAMGCVDVLPWERLSHNPFSDQFFGQDPPAFFSGPFFALETGGIDLTNFSFPPRGTMIVGSEELGVSPEALVAADASLGRVTIPSYGTKGSLNVSVAFGIVMQAWASLLHC